MDLKKCFESFNASLSEVEKAYGRIIRQIDAYCRQDTMPVEYLKELAGNLAHEIRNPLAGIAVLTELLAQQGEDDQARSIQGILHGVQRIDTIVESLIAFSQPLVFHTTQCNVGDLLQRAVEAARMQLQGACEDYRFELDLPQETIHREIDPALMLQAVQNVLKNSIEVMPDGGDIRLSLSHDEPKHILVVEIEDEGPGLTSADVDKPFYPFFTTKTYGMGLGLPASRLIVEKHGGGILIQNRPEPETGVRVILTLPMD